jgi:hypothetical protein
MRLTTGMRNSAFVTMPTAQITYPAAFAPAAATTNVGMKLSFAALTNPFNWNGRPKRIIARNAVRSKPRRGRHGDANSRITVLTALEASEAQMNTQTASTACRSANAGAR